MNKVLLGVLLGAVLGAVDGATAWFTPAVRFEIIAIIFYSTIKGLIAGVLIGVFARKVKSLPLGVLFGLAVGALLAWAVALMPDPSGNHYYVQIIIPGSLVGLIVGYATQKYGTVPTSAAAKT
jgi:hypothetical protein